jgi:hypothetical protein
LSKKSKMPVIASVTAAIVAVGAVAGYNLWKHYETAKGENPQLAIAAKDAENVKKITEPLVSLWPIGIAIAAWANRRQCGNFVKQCIKDCTPNSAGSAQNSGAVMPAWDSVNLNGDVVLSLNR